ncbi:conserved hypothetical protein [Ricinus communis]|uniref:Uncharacterized protein n=1 Tax=Ricinus communis TaxID=3988 RepID=B9SYE7_RICCO|nr:conserved hypothetical protein [Ricinus communis]
MGDGDDNLRFSDVDVGNEIGRSCPENLELSENDFGTEECVKGSKSLELNEENVKTEDCSRLQENLEENLVDAVTEEEAMDRDNLVPNQGDVRNEGTQSPAAADVDLGDSPGLQDNIEVAETVAGSGNLSSFDCRLKAENVALIPKMRVLSSATL